MRKYVFLFVGLSLFPFQAFSKNTNKDYERMFGVKELKGDRFIADLRYNSTDNFLKRNVYEEFGLNRCYVHPEMHAKLSRLESTLREKKLKLVLYDCFRPVEVQRQMWELIPDERYVADPRKGSNHNRGVAIDCALADENGKTLLFPTDFDDFTEKASHSYVCTEKEKQKCENRELLRSLMDKIGLELYPTEWWHYQLPDASSYPIVDVKNVIHKNLK